MASSHQLPLNNSMALPQIDKVMMTLLTQLSQTSGWLNQQFLLDQRFISGWDRARVNQMIQMAGKPGTDGRTRRFMDYYGGGIHFLSDKCGYMDLFSNNKIEIPYSIPVHGFAAWGRFYTNIRNGLYFDIDPSFTNPNVTGGSEEAPGTYRVQLGFQMVRHYPQNDRQFVETTHEHMIRRPYCQVLRLDRIVRKPGKV